jgi:hypothetical protein
MSHTPADIGSQDLTDGTWLYPEGFVHYLRHHRVKPPADFLEHLRRNNFELPILPTIDPGSGKTPALLLDVPVQPTYENELVIRFPARCLGWKPDAKWGQVERLWDEFSDQLDQAVREPVRNAEEGAARQSGAGRVTSALYPVLPWEAAEGSEITQFQMGVDSPLAVFTRIKPVLILRGLIEDVVVAWRRNSEKAYQVIWPIGYSGAFQNVEDIL